MLGKIHKSKPQMPWSKRMSKEHMKTRIKLAKEDIKYNKKHSEEHDEGEKKSKVELHKLKNRFSRS